DEASCVCYKVECLPDVSVWISVSNLQVLCCRYIDCSFWYVFVRHDVCANVVRKQVQSEHCTIGRDFTFCQVVCNVERVSHDNWCHVHVENVLYCRATLRNSCLQRFSFQVCSTVCALYIFCCFFQETKELGTNFALCVTNQLLVCLRNCNFISMCLNRFNGCRLTEFLEVQFNGTSQLTRYFCQWDNIAFCNFAISSRWSNFVFILFDYRTSAQRNSVCDAERFHQSVQVIFKL